MVECKGVLFASLFNSNKNRFHWYTLFNTSKHRQNDQCIKSRWWNTSSNFYILNKAGEYKKGSICFLTQQHLELFRFHSSICKLAMTHSVFSFFYCFKHCIKIQFLPMNKKYVSISIMTKALKMLHQWKKTIHTPVTAVFWLGSHTLWDTHYLPSAQHQPTYNPQVSCTVGSLLA